jgi:ribosomal protein S18 acetylase RimI-like enzyme
VIRSLGGASREGVVNALRIRRAGPADANAIGSMHVASWHESYAGILPDEMLAGLSVKARADRWRKALLNPAAFGDAEVFVAEQGDSIFAFGACCRQRDKALAAAGFDGEISALYVLHAHQRQGAGRSLMDSMARGLLAAGCSAASLWVLRENAPARAFYEHLGGEIVGRKADVRPNATLIEIAYAWRHLALLMR